MTSDGMGKTFGRCLCRHMRRKFPLVSMGGRAEGLASADPGARTPIGANGIIFRFQFSIGDFQIRGLLMKFTAVQFKPFFTLFEVSSQQKNVIYFRSAKNLAVVR